MLNFNLAIILTISIWTCAETRSLAVAESSTSSEVAESVTPVTELENFHFEPHTGVKQSNPQTPLKLNPPSGFTERVTPVTKLEKFPPEIPGGLSRSNPKDLQLAETEKSKSNPDLAQSPDSTSPSEPGRTPPPPSSDSTSPSEPGRTPPSPEDSNPPSAPGVPPGTPSNPSTTPPSPTKPVTPAFVLDNSQVDSSYLSDNFNLVIFSIEPSVQYRLRSGDKISFKVGYVNLEGQPGFDEVTIYPIRVGWEGNIDRATLRGGATLNLFDRLPSALGVDAGVSIPVFPNLILGATVERTPMKYAPSTLEIPQRTTYTSYGPTLFWQIDRNTSLSSFFYFLEYNDGNNSQLSYTKLKRQLGQFSIAANLVTSSFERDAAPFYFAPPDYLIYNGEVGWQGNITDYLTLRVQINLGEQRVQGEFSQALYYEVQLNAKLSPDADAFIKYTYGELDQVTYFRQRGGDPDDLYNQTTVTAQVRVKF